MSEIAACISGVDAAIAYNPSILDYVQIKAPKWLQDCVHQSAVMPDTLYSKYAIARMNEHIVQNRINVLQVNIDAMPSSNNDVTHNQEILDKLPMGLTGEYTGDQWGYSDGYIELTDDFWNHYKIQNRVNCNTCELEIGDQSWHKSLIWSEVGVLNPLARIPYGHNQLYVFVKTKSWLLWAKSNCPFNVLL